MVIRYYPIPSQFGVSDENETSDHTRACCGSVFHHRGVGLSCAGFVDHEVGSEGTVDGVQYTLDWMESNANASPTTVEEWNWDSMDVNDWAKTRQFLETQNCRTCSNSIKGKMTLKDPVKLLGWLIILRDTVQ
jgi:hypothetical protein